MKTLFLSFIAAALLFTACNQSNGNTASTTGNASDAPVMKFEKESHDFGKIRPGDIVTYDFKFTNAGKSPLIITDGYATCGCTKPTWPTAPVKPGEGKMGLQDKMITLTANTNPAQNMVHLVGEVNPTL
jgi:hypothetical protein